MNWLRRVVSRVVVHISEHPDRSIAIVGAALLAAYLGATLTFPKPDGEVVVGDAKHHYVQLRSLLFDRDLDFRNEYMTLGHMTEPVEGAEWLFSDFTPTGRVRNYMPLGPALLWLPLYALAVVVKIGLAWVGLGAYPTGYERSLQLVPGVTGVMATAVAMAFAWRLASRFTTRSAAVTAAFAVWIGSHALYYALVSPAYSHAASMFAASIFFWYWMAPAALPSLRRAVLLGLLAGVCALMRWQDALFVMVPIWEIVRWRESWGRRATALTLAGTGWLVAFAPQMAVWQVLYGKFFALPQGQSFMQWTGPHLTAVLFSIDRGLFTWAPLLVLAVLGLATVARDARWRVPMVGILLTSWYVNAAVADWWAGEAFGARRFLSLTPLFVVGLAGWLRPSARRLTVGAAAANTSDIRFGRLTIVAILTVANLLLLLQYQLALKGLEQIGSYPPASVYDMWVARFLVPWRLLWWRG